MNFRTASHEDADHAAHIRRAKAEHAAPTKDVGGGSSLLRQLQRTAGNRAVSQLLRGGGSGVAASIQRHLDGVLAASLQREAEDEELQMKRDASAPLQREAEDEELQMKREASTPLQREAEDEELQMKRDPAAPLQREAEDEELQMKPEVGAEGGPVSDGLASRISAARGSGSSLDDGTRAHMEQAFGTSFGDVHIHSGSEADTLNRSVSALAFTTGNDIFFRQGVYQPGSPDGNQLLAHELTHVVQQRTMPSSGGGMHVGPAGDSYEQEADARGAQVATAIERKADEQSAG